MSLVAWGLAPLPEPRRDEKCSACNILIDARWVFEDVTEQWYMAIVCQCSWRRKSPLYPYTAGGVFEEGKGVVYAHVRP